MGDNDVLSSLVAGMVQAGLLIILSDVPGVLHRRSAQAPRRAADSADHRPRSRDARAGRRERGTARQRRDGDQAEGGAAGGARGNQRDNRAGTRARYADGGARSRARNRHADPARATAPARPQALDRLRAAPARCARRSIAAPPRPCARRGRSLLRSGIREVRGEFASGDCVSLLDQRRRVRPRAGELSGGRCAKVKGLRSQEIPRVLGYKVADEIIHRDNFVLIEDLA